MQTPGMSISSFWDPTDDEGGSGSERGRFPSASCVGPRGRFSSFLGTLRLASWQRNMPGRLSRDLCGTESNAAVQRIFQDVMPFKIERFSMRENHANSQDVRRGALAPALPNQ